jgi:hypothetical protein
MNLGSHKQGEDFEARKCQRKAPWTAPFWSWRFYYLWAKDLIMMIMMMMIVIYVQETSRRVW